MTNQYQRFRIRQFRGTGTEIATISVENRASWLLRLILAVSVLAFTASPVFAADPRAETGEWSPVMGWPLIAMHANLLKNGMVLVWDEESTTTQPRLWDPATETFTDTPLVDRELWCSGHAQLADGKILVAGGHKPSAGEAGINTTFQYDPDTNSWTPTADMAYERWYPALTKLSDGRVSIVSGQITTDVFADIPEIYDPADGSINPLRTVATTELQEEEYPANFHLPNGMILAISPQYGPVQLLDPNASTWTSVNTTPVILGSAVQYRPGKILMSGGGTSFLSPSLRLAAVLDMNDATPTWKQTASMSFERYMHNLVMLPTGVVLAVGGISTADTTGTNGPLPVEAWDPNTETWTTLASLQLSRMYHSTALLLPDGRVLAAGGGHAFGPPPNLFSAQVFSPPYLFKGPRPTITSAPDAVPYSSPTFIVGSPDATTIASVALIGLGSVTHGTDMTSFYAELFFSKTANELIIDAPQNGNEVPPGYYMLFIVDAHGVPSIAKILKIGSASTPPPPPPTLTALSPSSATAGGPGFTLTTTGSNFVRGSVVRWNGANRTTTFVNSTQLTAGIPAADIASPGTAQVTAANPDSAVSNALTFTVGSPSPPPLATTVQPPVLCNGLPTTIVGTDGNDYLVGTPGNDVIAGLAGDDRIFGLGGNDVICGGPGNDKLYGNSGNDTLFGGAGNDVLKGGPGRDRLYGYSGNDAMDGGPGFDRCNGRSGTDKATRCERTTRAR